jgi:molybdate transport system ATP-binding protein
MLSVALKKRRGSFCLDVAFDAPTPGIVAFFGRSGAGKTTLIDMIAGLIGADEGKVQLDDSVLMDSAAGIALPAEARRIGYVFQESRLFPHLSVRGNLAYGLKRAPLPHTIGSDEVVALLGLASLLARRPHTLSGGERQRVALGRALLSQPRLLLLDEPLASLDAPRRAEVLPYLEALRDRLSIPMIYVSHQFDEVLRLASYLVLIENGHSIAAGGMHEMSLRPELSALVGAEQVGAVLEGVMGDVDRGRGLAELHLGNGTLLVSAQEAHAGARARVQLLARDLIIATQPVQGLSVRNSLAGTVSAIRDDDGQSRLVSVDIGGACVLARVTQEAVQALALAPGLPVFVLVKAVAIRSQRF